MTIWKFPLKLQDRQEIRVPDGTVFLRCQWREGDLTLWGIVNPDNKVKPCAFRVIGTGHQVPNIPLTFIDTVQTPNGAFVWHVFMETR